MDATIDRPPASLVEHGRVHRRVYADPAIFALEQRRIFGRAWIFVGHESQVPKPGDFHTTTLAGRPVIMVRAAEGRAEDGGVRVLFNRCPHRGALVAAERAGNADLFRCAYHGWTFRLDGTLQSVPREEDYAGTGFDRADCRLQPLPRAGSYRGFVFASLAAEGPALREFLGPAAANLDNMVARAPDGALEIAGGRFETLQRNNWKIYLENLHDGAHPMIVHQSSIMAARNAAAAAPDFLTRFRAEAVAANGQNYEQMGALEVTAYPRGHSEMKGFRRTTADEAGYRDYVAKLEARLGAAEAERVLGTQRHNAMFYPSMSVHPVFMQLRVIRPLAPDLTQIDIWVLKMKGAPEWMHRRNVAFANTIHSPSSIVKADDNEIYERVQRGTAAEAATAGGDWIDLRRGAGSPAAGGAGGTVGGVRSTAMSEDFIRNQYRAWQAYMSAP